MDGLDLDLYRGEVLGFVGGSGQGKSVLMRTILGLVRKRSGTIRLFGQDRDALLPRELRMVEQRWGVLFQNGALFSSLTVKQNIQMPMRENRDISQRSWTIWRCSTQTCRTSRRRRRQISLGIVGRHGEEGGARQSPGVGSRTRVSRRTHVWPGSHRRRRLRRIDRHAEKTGCGLRHYGDARS